AAPQPGDPGGQPVVQGRFLQFYPAIEEMGQAPDTVVEKGLGVHRGTGLVAVPEGAVGETIEEKKENANCEMRNANCELKTSILQRLERDGPHGTEGPPPNLQFAIRNSQFAISRSGAESLPLRLLQPLIRRAPGHQLGVGTQGELMAGCAAYQRL